MIARRNLDRDLSLWRRGHPDDKAAAEEKKEVFQPSADLNARRRLAVTGRFKRASFFDGDGLYHVESMAPIDLRTPWARLCSQDEHVLEIMFSELG